MQRVQAGADLGGQPQDVVSWKPALGVEARGQGAPGHVLDHQEGMAVGLARLDDPHQVPVLDLGRRPGLVGEPVPVHRVVGELGAEHLERDHQAVRLAHGAEDDAGRALAEPRVDPVAPHPVADAEAGTCRFPTTPHRP